MRNESDFDTLLKSLNIKRTDIIQYLYNSTKNSKNSKIQGIKSTISAFSAKKRSLPNWYIEAFKDSPKYKELIVFISEQNQIMEINTTEGIYAPEITDFLNCSYKQNNKISIQQLNKIVKYNNPYNFYFGILIISIMNIPRNEDEWQTVDYLSFKDSLQEYSSYLQLYNPKSCSVDYVDTVNIPREAIYNIGSLLFYDAKLYDKLIKKYYSDYSWQIESLNKNNNKVKSFETSLYDTQLWIELK